MSLSPEHAKVLLEAGSLPALKAEYPVTQRVIAAIPAEQASHKPDGVARSAIELAWHIVMAENRFLQAVINGAFDLTPLPLPEAVRTGEAVNDWYAGRFAKNLELLKQMSGDALVKVVDFRGMFQFPAVVYAEIGLHHSIHHRGQLSTYLRPMGAKVPTIYGESHDARVAREAAQGTAGAR